MKHLMMILLLILSLGCVGQKPGYTGEESPIEESSPEAESLKIAREFVLNSPTYRFDGEDLTHIETVTAACPSCWVFIFEFTSRKAGYGDRSKQQVAQVITQHTAKVTVENGKVTAAVLDDVWDMISQKMIDDQEESCAEEEISQANYTEEESLEIAREFVLKSPTYRFDGENLKHIETLPAACPNCWVFIFEFTSRKAGYGDRSKQQVAQVITQHTAKVTVENGKVTAAVLDDVWDMINQKMIE